MSEEHINHLKEFDRRVSEEWRKEFDREGVGIHDGREEERRRRQEGQEGIYMARGMDVRQGEEGEEEEGKTGGKGICMARLPARKPFGRLGGQPHGRRDHAPTFYALLVVAWLVIVGSLLLLVARS